jgi:signal transduction histidine kinase
MTAASSLRGSVRLRITAVVVLVTALAVAAGGWGMLRAVERTQLAQISRDIEERLSLIVDQLEAGVPPEMAALDAGETVGFVQVLDATGDVLVSSPGLAAGSVTIASGTAGGGTIERRVGGSDMAVPFEFRYERVDAVPGGPVTVVSASPLDEVARSLDAVRTALWVGLPALVALAGAVGWVVVGRALRPVEAMRLEVATVTADTLHRRVPEPTADDELARLARTMNDMLDRLERAADRQRQFVADASHELRSPVAALRAQLEVAQRAGRPAALRAAVDAALAEEARLEALLADLLLLAAVEDGPLPPLAPLDVGAVATREAARPRRVPVRVTVDPGTPLVGAASAPLTRAVANLLDNAARHAQAAVAVGVRGVDGRAVLTVDDDGPGIPDADRQRVFERFVRLDEGRARDDGGAGLGLALVRAVVEQLGGSVAVATSPTGGARLEVSLPGVRPGAG